MLEGGPEFDWNGRFFRLRRLETNPVSIQRPRPLVMSAGFSPEGRDFAAQAADALFTTMTGTRSGTGHACERGRSMRVSTSRQLPVYAMGHVVVPADARRSGGVLRTTSRRSLPTRRAKPTTAAGGARRPDRPRPGAASVREPLHAHDRQVVLRRLSGTYPFVGTPDDVASEMARMSAAGLAGTSVAFLDYLKEIP